MIMEIIEILVTINYCKDDDTFMSDYCEVDIKIENVTSQHTIYENGWGDYYHDKGLEKCMAIVDFVKTVYGKDHIVSVITNKTATYDC